MCQAQLLKFQTWSLLRRYGLKKLRTITYLYFFFQLFIKFQNIQLIACFEFEYSIHFIESFVVLSVCSLQNPVAWDQMNGNQYLHNNQSCCFAHLTYKCYWGNSEAWVWKFPLIQDCYHGAWKQLGWCP